MANNTLAMKKLFLLTVLMTTALVVLRAQDISTSSLSWTVTQLTDLNTNITAPYTCTFKTGGTAEILWVQKNNYTRKLEVQHVTGTWTDVSAPGQAVYSIAEDGDTGTVTFERTSSGIYITLNLSQGAQPRLRQKYSVAQVN